MSEPRSPAVRDESLQETTPEADPALVDELRMCVMYATSNHDGEGEPKAAMTCFEMVQEHKELIKDCVHFLKCRIEVIHPSRPHISSVAARWGIIEKSFVPRGVVPMHS